MIELFGISFDEYNPIHWFLLLGFVMLVLILLGVIIL
jgi:hypothetical protein